MREPVRTPTEQRDPPTQLRGCAAHLSGRPESSVLAEDALQALARLLARQAAADATRSKAVMSSMTKTGTMP